MFLLLKFYRENLRKNKSDFGKKYIKQGNTKYFPFEVVFLLCFADNFYSKIIYQENSQ